MDGFVVGDKVNNRLVTISIGLLMDSLKVDCDEKFVLGVVNVDELSVGEASKVTFLLAVPARGSLEALVDSPWVLLLGKERGGRKLEEGGE